MQQRLLTTTGTFAILLLVSRADLSSTCICLALRFGRLSRSVSIERSRKARPIVDFSSLAKLLMTIGLWRPNAASTEVLDVGKRHRHGIGILRKVWHVFTTTSRSRTPGKSLPPWRWIRALVICTTVCGTHRMSRNLFSLFATWPQWHFQH